MMDFIDHPAPMAYIAKNRCFACGPANDNGLHLDFSLAPDGSTVCLTTIPNCFEGPPGYLHGGILATLLDEAMSKLMRAQGLTSVTRRMEIDLLRPVHSATPIRLEGRLIHSEGRKHWLEARILNSNGRVLTEAKGLFIEIRSNHGLSNETSATVA
jgi:uncharacterized protein (TIGR00369 family)